MVKVERFREMEKGTRREVNFGSEKVLKELCLCFHLVINHTNVVL